MNCNGVCPKGGLDLIFIDQTTDQYTNKSFTVAILFWAITSYRIFPGWIIKGQLFLL